MPDLSALLRTTQIDHILNRLNGRVSYSEPTAFQVSVCARVLDKALGEWERARIALAEHAAGSRQFGGLFEAFGELENVVISLDRLMRYTSALRSVPQIASLASMPLPSSADAARVRAFRNRVIHGDEDLAVGRGGQGLATATLEVRATDIVMQGRLAGSLESLSYSEIARWLEEIYGFTRTVIAGAP